MRVYLSLLKKELKSISREKTIIFAIIIQLLIASFSSVILSGILAFYNPVALVENVRFTPRVGYIGDIDNPLVGYLRSNRIVVRPFTEMTTAEATFQARGIDAIILVPESHSDTVDMRLMLPKRETMRIFMLVMLDEPLKKYENYLRENNGIYISYQDTEGKPYSTYEILYAVIIPILMLFPALVAGSIVIDTISEEFENKTFETLMSTPASAGKVFAAKISAAVIVAIIQMVVWIGLLKANGMAIYNPFHLLTASVILATTIAFGAAAIALFFKDRERAQFVYSLTLIIIAVSTYFLNVSPIILLTRLSAGVQGVGILETALCVIPLMVIAIMFLNISHRLMLVRR